MKRYGCIYKITNLINGKIYIGQTTQTVEQRWRGHVKWSNKYKNNSYLHSAIRKYGESNFKVETIDIAFTLDELNNKEKYWVDYYHTQNPDIGYNSVPGGICNPMNIDKIKIKHDNIMRSEEVRKKISESMKTYRATHVITEETRRKLSIHQKGQVWVNKDGEKKKAWPEEISKYLDLGYSLGSKVKGEKYMRKPITEETRRRLSAHQKGQVWVNKDGVKKRIWPKDLQEYMSRGYVLGTAKAMSTTQKQALNESHYKQVVCIDESDTIIKKFDTVREASIWLNEKLGNKYRQPISAAGVIKKSADKNVYIYNLKWQYLQ